MKRNPRSIWTAVATVAVTSLPLSAGTFPKEGAQGFALSDGTVDMADGSLAGSDKNAADGKPVAGVIGGALRLASKDTADAVGSYKLPVIDPDGIVSTLDVSFTVAMDKGAGNAGEGWSVNFGAIPADNGGGEGGFANLPNGLTIAFDTFDNGGDAPSIEIVANRVSIGNFTQAFNYGTSARGVVIHWDSAGLDLTYDGKKVCVDLPTSGFAPTEGGSLAFTARTTAQTQDVFLDDVKVSTTTVPAIQTGGPIISEFVAFNNLLEDEDADKPGWIELFNGSPNPIAMEGYALTDDSSNLGKWKLPAITLHPYQYRVIYASGKDRSLSASTLATGLLHANFSLANKSGYLALVKPDGKTLASEFNYGQQYLNVSYGEKGKERTKGFISPPTPGLSNSGEVAAGGMSEDVVFDHPGGVVTGAFDLVIKKPAEAGAEVRYTLDNTNPTPTSTVYTVPIRVEARTTVRARVYAPNKLPGAVTGRTFLFVDATLSNFAGTGKPFESNLPVIFLDSFGFNVDTANGGGVRPFRLSYGVVIPTDPVSGRASLTGTPEYLGRCGTHVRGESSAGFTQRSYALEIWNDDNQDTDASLLGMPADSDWALYGPWSEKTMMRNKLVFDWMIRLRGYDGTAVRTRFVELFFNQSRTATQLNYTGTYKGVYVLMEKLKRGKDRTPLANLNALTTDPAKITGGYIFRKDKDDAQKTQITSKIGGLQSFDPDKLNTVQAAYLKKYIADMENALNGSKSADPAVGYAAYLDPGSFIDAQWMLEIAKQVDGYVFSTYWHKDRGGKIKAGPLWDFNISLGNADYATGDKAAGWLYDVANGVGQLWYPRLHSDANYKIAHWDRYWHMRRSFLATDKAMATIDAHMKTLLDGYEQDVGNRSAESIQNPVARHYRKYPQLGVRDWPNPPATTKLKTYQADVGYMKDWLTQRLAWIDDQTMLVSNVIYRPPNFSHYGGPVSGAVELKITPYEGAPPANRTYANGTLYYTTDGSDPRDRAGAVNATAKEYAAPLNVASSTTVRARLNNGGRWSALTEATFLVNVAPASAGNLVVSEIMYNPEGPSSKETAVGIVNGNVFEYIELANIGQQDVDLNGVRLTEGIEFDFSIIPGSQRLLAPGQAVLIVSDRDAFFLRHPNVPPSRVAGVFSGSLANGGEQISIVGADGKVIKQFSYDDDTPWPIQADTLGHSLELQNLAANPDHGGAASWRASVTAEGTPGEASAGGAPNPAKDSDGDGLSDLFETATGSNPNDPASMRLPRTSLDAEGRVIFEFRRSQAGEAMKFNVESSSDLRTWTANAGVVAPLDSAKNDDGASTVRYRGNARAAGALFLRLHVSQ